MKATFGLAGLVLVTLDLAATAIASSKIVGFDFEKRPNILTRENDRFRRRQSKSLTVTLDNENIAYVINITLGTPPQNFTVQLDTGSADLWVPSVDCDICLSGYDEACSAGVLDPSASSSYQDNVIDQEFQISYQDGSGVIGEYINETLFIGQTEIKQMTLGLALQASRGIGILGIGYSADESIASEDPDAIYPNLINQLRDQGYINTLAYSLWLNDLESETGSILFGGLDTAKYQGDLTVLPVQKGSDGGYTDFTVVLSSLSFVDAKGETQLPSTNLSLPVILDSGTTASYVPDDIAQDILQGVGAVETRSFGYIVPCSLGGSDATFVFGFGGDGGPTINVSLSQFVLPINDDTGYDYKFPGTDEPVCGWGLRSTGTGDEETPILLGDTFLRSAYVVYNLANNEIGIAQTDFNATDTNLVEISGTAIPSAARTASGVAVTQTYTGHPLEQGHTVTVYASFTGGPQSPTFDLGTVSTALATVGPAKKKSVAPLVMPPGSVGAMGLVTVMVVAMSMMFGGALIMRM